MGIVDPLVLRKDADQILFDLDWFLMLGQLKTPRNPQNVRIDHYAGGDLKPRTQHHVRRLARNAGECDEFLNRLRYFVAEVFYDHPRSTLNVLRLRMVKTRRTNDLFDGWNGSFSKRLRGREGLEERRRHGVHRHIRGLRRERSRDHKLPR